MFCQVLSSEPNSSTVDSYSPEGVIHALGRNGWTILPGEQDAHELFHHLIFTIEEEASKNNCRVSF